MYRYQCDQFLLRAQICKNTGGVRAHFFAKIRTLTVKYSIFRKWQELLFLQCCQFLDGPANNLSGLCKLELLSSDSFYFQGLSKLHLGEKLPKGVSYTVEVTKIRLFYWRFSQNTRRYRRTRIYTGGLVTLHHLFSPNLYM